MKEQRSRSVPLFIFLVVLVLVLCLGVYFGIFIGMRVFGGG